MKLTAYAILYFVTAMSAVAQTTADLVFTGGNIVTLDRRNTRAEAMAVIDGRIVAIGRSSAVKRFIGPKTTVLNGERRLVLPGFNDAHVHLTGIGNMFSHLDLRDVTSRGEVISRIRHFVHFLPKGRWIIGAGLQPDRLDEPLSLDIIDKACPDNPLLLYIDRGRSIVANSAALKRAGISAATRDPSDGAIARDISGRPTGFLTGSAVSLVSRHIPADHASNWAEIVETASNYAASLGVTSLQDVHSDDLVAVLERLDREGRLKTRVYECVGVNARIKAPGPNRGLVRSGCVKGTAHGVPEEVEELRRDVMAADKAGLQVMVHAIGPLSNRNALNAFENAARVNGPRDRRFRLEHAARLDRTDLPRLERLGIIASMQPHLFYYPGHEGDDYAGFLLSGVRVAFGSDASITDLNPLLGIHAAVNAGRTSISVEEAVRAYTHTSAYAEFQESVKGTLEVGKAADFVILSEDIFTIDRNRIAGVKVLLTVTNGEVVYNGL